MKNYILFSLAILIIFNSSFQSKKNKQDQYEIMKIDSINSWYIVFAKKQDSMFKIVSYKQNYSACEKIEEGKRYAFALNSVFKKAVIGNKTFETPLNVTCLSFDDSTAICIDREKGIYDLYLTPDLNGLCIDKNK